MSLRIGQFNTACHFPARFRREAELVDGLARGRFARDLGEYLGPSLARQPAIVRIRQLPLRVLIPARELNQDALSLRWRQAFGKALFTALAYPTGVGPFEVFRAESVASFVASAIRSLLDGTAANAWQYAEFEPFFRKGSTPGALALICEWPRQSMAVLLDLAQRGVLDRLLARFDDLALERLFALLARPPDSETEPLWIADLIAAAKLALARLPEKTVALRSRAYALSLFVEAHRARQYLTSPRALFHALLALAVLLNDEVFWPDSSREELWVKRLPLNVRAVLESLAMQIRREMQTPSSMDVEAMPGALAQRGRTAPPLIGDLHRLLSGLKTRGAIQSPRLAELPKLLAQLRGELHVPPPSDRPAEVRWISSGWCGMFFLMSTLARLGWIPAWNRLAEFETGGVACLVAGLALAIAEKFDPAVPPMDPAIALFAGYLGDPAIAHMRGVFQEFPRESRAKVLQAALPHQAGHVAAESWEATFALLAETLLRDFAARIRGFRQATRQNIVRSFLARPGTIRVEDERIVVFPDPSPFHVALHIAGMDGTVEASLWLGGRPIEFHLADL
jgi:hypothetical protein